MRHPLAYIWLCCLTAMMLSCQDDGSGGGIPSGYKVVSIGLNLSIPADEGDATRALPGDPGMSERFRFPTLGYIYFVPIDGSGAGKVYKPAELSGDSDNPKLTELDNPIALESWVREEYGFTVPQTRGDSIYRYHGYIHFLIPSGTTTGRLYIAASAVALPNLTAISYSGVNPATDERYEGTATEDDVLGITFDVEGDNIRDNLQNIYSTPYNYKPYDELEGSLLNGSNYYGTVDVSTTSQISLMLYHVASKVDIVWNVSAGQQQNFWISFIEARKLCEKGCLLFRPTKNVCTELKEWTGGINVPSQAKSYDLTLMGWNGTDAGGSFNDDRGRQWNGRQYFYTIPFRTKDTNYFDLQLRMLKNDATQANANDGYNLLLRRDMSQADTVFVPWQRFDLRFTNEMEYKKDMRIIND